MSGGVYFHVGGFDGFQKVDFEKSEIKKALRQVGRLIRDDARRRVNKKGKADKYPAKRTGTLRQSIRFKVTPSGFLVRVAPYKTAKMKDFYPAYLQYGVKKSPLKGKERERARRRGRLQGPWRIEPSRGNYMADALKNNEKKTQDIVLRALKGALHLGMRDR